jgi:ArsR family transcriptional regulator, arsenate/arsenite/antimonite-responsive transcriptional repressor
MGRAEVEIENLAEFFKSLSHPVRLLILNLVKNQPRHGEELASILSLNPATISHHLQILANTGLLTSEKNQYYQIYTLNRLPLNEMLTDLIFHDPGITQGNIEVDAFRKKVLATFFYRGRLKSIPAQLKKRQIVLAKIAEAFEPDREYTEREVNIILVDFHDDIATLRRGLIESRLLTRQRGIYKLRTKNATALQDT